MSSQSGNPESTKIPRVFHLIDRDEVKLSGKWKGSKIAGAGAGHKLLESAINAIEERTIPGLANGAAANRVA